jgi:hypothetical protein
MTELDEEKPIHAHKLLIVMLSTAKKNVYYVEVKRSCSVCLLAVITT